QVFQEASEKEAECEKADREFQMLSEQTEAANMNYEKIKAEYEENMPILIQNIERYKTAQTYEKEYEDAKRKYEQLAKHYETEQTKAEREREKLQQAQAELSQIDAKIRSLDAEIAAFTVDSSERERVQQAIFAKKQIIDMQHALATFKDEYAQKQREREQLQQNYAELVKKNEAARRRGAELFQKLHRQYMDAA